MCSRNGGLNMSFNIAIDGPSGAGKSTISKEVARQLGIVYVDTGALYRSIGLYFYKNNISLDNENKIVSELDNISVKLAFDGGEQQVLLNGENVSADIRLHIISEYASKVSAIPEVRKFLLQMQRNIASSNNIVMDGRDIGTVVLPKAELKIFLTASAEVRAKRRYQELLKKNQVVDYDTILKDIIDRDNRDMTREIAPLKVADDAIVVDTSDLNFEQSVQAILDLIKERIK